MPLPWHYTTEFWRGLGVCDLMQGRVYLQIVQSRREGTAVRQSEVFLRRYMAGKPASTRSGCARCTLII